MSIPQRHRYEQARKANLARELEQARETEAFLADLPDINDVLRENTREAAEADRSDK
ncbi:MAG: hypothetical protein WC121_11925 [Candidatus Kapaibacterium sp.]|jgi:hypothetical protein